MDVRAGVIDKINEYGMKVIIDDQLPADLSDMSTTLTKVKALKPDALIISGHSKGAATAARQIDEMKVNVPMIALTHCEGCKSTGKVPEDCCWLLVSDTMGLRLFQSPTQCLVRPLTGMLASRPTIRPTLRFRTSLLRLQLQLCFKEAFEAANSFDKDKLRDAISAVEMETFYGDIKFSAQGNNIAADVHETDRCQRFLQRGRKGFDDMAYPRQVAY